MAVFILISLVWGILLGLIFSQFVLLPPLLVLVCIAIAISLISASWILQSNFWFRGGLLLGGFMIGVMLWQNAQFTNQYENIIGTNIDMHGIVVARPTITSSGNQAVVVRPDGFSQNLRASLFYHTYVRGGERVWIRGQVKQSENFNNFDYVNYLKQQNIYAELTKAKIIVLSPNRNKLDNFLNQLRQQVIHRAEFILDEPTAAIVLGMLIGEQEQLPSNIQQSFQKVGLVHILVVSGFNLTIIAIGVGIFAKVWGRRWADVISLVIIWLFVILVGNSAAVTRAGVMASLLITARLSGRLALSSVTLLFAVVAMVLLNPWQLFYNIGFQLSIAATFGVLEANQLRLGFEKEGWLSELIWSSFGAIIMTAPIVAYYFGTFSVIAPLANLLILPSVPYLMLFGALSLLPYLHIIFVPITETLVAWQIGLINWLASLSFSQIEIKPDFSLIISYYALVLIFKHVVKFHQKLQLKESDSHGKITKIII